MWSNVLDFSPWICMVGLMEIISLFGLHSLMGEVRFGCLWVGDESSVY